MTVYKQTEDGVVPIVETPVVQVENKPFCGKIPTEDQPTTNGVEDDS